MNCLINCSAFLWRSQQKSALLTLADHYHYHHQNKPNLMPKPGHITDKHGLESATQWKWLPLLSDCYEAHCHTGPSNPKTGASIPSADKILACFLLVLLWSWAHLLLINLDRQASLKTHISSSFFFFFCHQSWCIRFEVRWNNCFLHSLAAKWGKE